MWLFVSVSSAVRERVALAAFSTRCPSGGEFAASDEVLGDVDEFAVGVRAGRGIDLGNILDNTDAAVLALSAACGVDDR